MQPTSDDDPISLWLSDSLHSVESVLSSADEMGWNPAQIQELQNEVEFFRALMTGADSIPRPPDAVLELVRGAIMRWQEAVDWTNQQAHVDESRIRSRNALNGRLQRLRNALEGYI
jgi:hypothetical protein